MKDESRIVSSIPSRRFYALVFRGKRTGFICTLPILYSFILFLLLMLIASDHHRTTTKEITTMPVTTISSYLFFCALQIIGQIVGLSFCILRFILTIITLLVSVF